MQIKGNGMDPPVRVWFWVDAAKREMESPGPGVILDEPGMSESYVAKVLDSCKASSLLSFAGIRTYRLFNTLMPDGVEWKLFEGPLWRLPLYCNLSRAKTLGCQTGKI